MFKDKFLQTILRTGPLGLKLKVDDPNGYKFGILFGLFYKPKHTRKVLDVMSAKSQYKNTCGWVATTGAKEHDEKVYLDERGIIAIAAREGKLSGDGFSTLLDNEKVLHTFGIPEKGLIKSSYRSWKEYINSSILTAKVLQNALTHRSDSFWAITRASEIYKALDDGRPVKIGIGWCRAFNMSGGFKMPWLISKIIGFLAGGHALYLRGYDQNYEGRKVFIIRNSFGAWWGDKGDCYITEKHLMKEIGRYGAYVNLDIKSDVGKILMEMDGKNVKSDDSPAIWHIQQGKKKLYPNWSTFLAWNQLEKGYETVDRNVLEQIPQGDDMDITKSIYWEFIKNLKDPEILKELLSILYKK